MEYFVDDSIVRSWVIRLDKDDDMLDSINAVIKECGIDNAVVVSGIGTLYDARIHMIGTTGYPAVEKFPVWKNKPIEVSSLSGIIASGEPHIHIVFSDSEGCYSGHLEKGCRVLYLAEIVIQSLGIGLERVRDEKGINVLRRKNNG